MKITVVGAGFVGMSTGVLLSQNNHVVIFDTDKDKVKKINNGLNTIDDNDIDFYLKTKKLNLTASSSLNEALLDSKLVIIATPTDYDPNNNNFNTSSIDSTIERTLNVKKEVTFIIKSTIPIGYTENLKNRFNFKKIIFSPEFLREGSALMDSLYPSRIIFGGNIEDAKEYESVLLESILCNKKDLKILYMNSKEAEAVKLFSNTYLAMRVSFFNELDSFSVANNINSKEVIEGVSSDKRIGHYYNNPSFGYGGYCLPKDTKQLLANFESIPQEIISAVIKSNDTRMNFITNEILKINPKNIGVFRLMMKNNSKNFRSSSIINIIQKLKDKNVKLFLYEPEINAKSFMGLDVISELNVFKNKSDLIIANRNSNLLNDVKDKIFTRDLFGES